MCDQVIQYIFLSPYLNYCDVPPKAKWLRGFLKTNFPDIVQTQGDDNLNVGSIQFVELSNPILPLEGIHGLLENVNPTQNESVIKLLSYELTQLQVYNGDINVAPPRLDKELPQMFKNGAKMQYLNTVKRCLFDCKHLSGKSTLKHNSSVKELNEFTLLGL